MSHSLVICEEVAHRMKDIEFVSETVLFSEQSGLYYADGWDPSSLGTGFAGIACFYATMDSFFPDNGWDQVAHLYLSRALQQLEVKSDKNLSLFSGISGLAFAIQICSQIESRYRETLLTFDRLIEDRLREELNILRHTFPAQSPFLSPSVYNLFHGMAGVLTYLTLRLHQDPLRRLAFECTEFLLEILNVQVAFQDALLPSWYVSVDHQLVSSEAEKYPQGSFLLNHPFGITGVLSALSIAALSGIRCPNLLETIQMISRWHVDAAYENEKILCWSNTIPYVAREKDGSSLVGTNLLVGELERDSWWYGIPCVTRALSLAGKATADRHLMDFASESFLGMFSKEKKQWNVMGPAFMHGRAGVLALTFQMAQEKKCPLLQRHAYELEMDLKNFYRPGTPFGFQGVDVDEAGQYHWVDSPGLLDGAAGIALSLLLVQGREQPPWHRALLLG